MELQKKPYQLQSCQLKDLVLLHTYLIFVLGYLK